jgi:hypothetical protein
MCNYLNYDTSNSAVQYLEHLFRFQQALGSDLGTDTSNNETGFSQIANAHVGKLQISSSI